MELGNGTTKQDLCQQLRNYEKERTGLIARMARSSHQGKNGKRAYRLKQIETVLLPKLHQRLC